PVAHQAAQRLGHPREAPVQRTDGDAECDLAEERAKQRLAVWNGAPALAIRPVHEISNPPQTGRASFRPTRALMQGGSLAPTVSPGYEICCVTTLAPGGGRPWAFRQRGNPSIILCSISRRTRHEKPLDPSRNHDPARLRNVAGRLGATLPDQASAYGRPVPRAQRRRYRR